MSHITVSLIRLSRALALSSFVCIVIYFFTNSVSDLLAQPTGVVCSNPGFETGDLSCWSEGGDPGLVREVQTQTVSSGNYAAVTGDPFETQAECAGHLPLGSAWIGYTFTVPIQVDPYFSFDYRIFSYDEMPAGYEDVFDKFDVYIDDLSDPQPPFRVLRDGSQDGVPSGTPRPCDFPVDDSGWLSVGWSLNSIPDFDNPGQTYDLRGKTINVIFQVFSQELVGDYAWYNTWVYIDNLQLRPEMVIDKSNDPSGPVHEGDVITYTISYANTGLATQNGVVITDRIPSNTELVSVSSPPDYEIVANSVISWTIGDLAVGETGVVSFQVRVPLLPSLSQSVDMLSSREAYPPAQVVPVPIACDTTRFWAIGVTRQPPEPIPHTIQVQIPPGTSPSEMWLLMKETDNISPTVEGHPAQLVRTSSNSFGASLWTAPITSAMVASGEVTVITHNPRQLNALFLFDAKDPPFEEAALDDFYKITKTFTYALDIPSVATKTIDVILPFMDITYWTNSSPPELDTRKTTVTVQFDGQSHTLTANDPNLGNGLLMTQFPFTIGPLSAITSTKVLTVTVDTEDSVYTLGPRVCRPIYIENTAWLCSDQLGCISDTATNIPDDIVWPGPGTGGLYLPIILKSSP
jgi:uncharacterized repeat protein (TIGR01451 family)